MIDGKVLGPNQPDQLDVLDIWVRVASSLNDLDITPFGPKRCTSFR